MMLLTPARGKAVSSCSPAMYDALLALRVAMRSRAGRHWALAEMPVAVVAAALVIPFTGAAAVAFLRYSLRTRDYLPVYHRSS